MSIFFKAALVTLLLAPNLGWAQDFDKGLAAYNSGDFVTALKEWRPLAEQGDARAQSTLGWMYRNGQGVPQDYAEAVKWYHLAAEQGNAWVQNELGWMYATGTGVPQDFTQALKWGRLAAEQGFYNAQNLLGWMYATGNGVPQDAVAAHMWLNIAYANGDEGSGQRRDELAANMTPGDISEAQRRAQVCMASNYQDCN